MSENLAQSERRKYEDIWACDQYAAHSPGAMYVPVFLDMAGRLLGEPLEADSAVLDAGCGSGKGMLALRAAGFQDVRGCDFTDAGLVPEARRFPFHAACLWDDLEPPAVVMSGQDIDWVYCTDVLEHIPIAFTMLVVSRLLKVARRGAFFTISFQPDQMGYLVGRPLHETVMPFVWWRDQLDAVGELVEARDMLGAGAFLVRAR